MEVSSASNIERYDNIIKINRLDHSKCASDFLRTLQDCMSRGWKSIVVQCEATRIFPNACLPICGMIQYYGCQGIDFSYNIPKTNYLNSCGFSNPFCKKVEEIEQELLPFDKVYRFDSVAQIGKLTQAYVNSISHQMECQEGVLSGISWCINEIMDNVLTHSDSQYGLIMAQLHPQSRHIVFCVHDTGIGIHESLLKSKHHPKSELDSLSLAIQEGVGDGKGQGNGLYGLYQIVYQNRGRLTITSGNSAIMMRNSGEIEKYEHIPFIARNHKGTIIDFQLNLGKSIDIKEAFRTIGGYDGFDFRINDMLKEQDDYIHYDIFENSQGTATREAGRYIRNDIINILRREQRCIILDFSNVKTVSSSFIDELIAKLFLSLGFVNFNYRVNIAGMNDTVRFLCERSLYMRIHDEWECSKV